MIYSLVKTLHFPTNIVNVVNSSTVNNNIKLL